MVHPGPSMSRQYIGYNETMKSIQAARNEAGLTTRWTLHNGHGPAHCTRPMHCLSIRHGHRIKQYDRRDVQTTAASKSQDPSSRSASLTPAAKAALFTGTYATLAGLALTVWPISSFGLLFDAATVPSAWIRVGGILFATIGLQYLFAGWRDSKLPASPGYAAPAGASASASWRSAQAAPAAVYARSFYIGTVWSRCFLVLGFTALVITSQSPPALLLLAVLNAAGAMSMALAVKKTDTLWEHVGVRYVGAPHTSAVTADADFDGRSDYTDCNPLGMGS